MMRSGDPMKLLLLSDIHAYAGALDRVLADAGGRWDEAVVLGDVVGYGPDPVRTLRAVRGLRPRAIVAGNHEAMLWRLLDGEDVRAAPHVVVALKRHAMELDEDDVAFLRSLDLEHREDAWAAVHGSPNEPFAYLASPADAAAAERHMPRDTVFVGHTHVPGAFWSADGAWREVHVDGSERSWAVPEGAKAFVNPGSVGPARDGGEGASYAVFDEATREVVWRRGV